MHNGKEEEEEEDILLSKRKTFDNCKWKLAWALPLLLHFLLSLSTHMAHNNDPTNNNRNRQLLEHGLRGNDAPNTNRTLDNHNNSTSSIPASNLTIPLHAHSGTHHVHLYVGSPPQKQTLIVDTGSRAMAFPCTIAGMSDCCGSHASDYFDPSQSTTHFVSKCGNCVLEGISACRQPLSFPGQSAKPNYFTFLTF